MASNPAPLHSSSPRWKTRFPESVDVRLRDERLQAMKGLVGDVAHALNNSLAPMAGYMTLLGSELKAGTASEQYLGRFEQSLRRTQTVIEAIVQATHPERQLVAKEIDFSLLVQQTTQHWRNALSPSLGITVETDVAPCVLWLDDNQWIKAINHLLRNAEFALAKGGLVAISLQQTTLAAAETEQLGLRQSEVFEFVIHDTGCGMSNEVLGRAYDPLFTTRHHAPPAGLGLTLVHSVVLLQGGQIWIDSTEGSGTTVRIWLPAEP
jgi:signal transduction histidine kinase